MEKLYKMSYGNKGIENSSVYKFVRETKCFLFVRGDIFVFRISKRNNKLIAIKEGKNPYRFDMPNVTKLITI